jgi:hypothetical protein
MQQDIKMRDFKLLRKEHEPHLKFINNIYAQY